LTGNNDFFVPRLNFFNLVYGWFITVLPGAGSKIIELGKILIKKIDKIKNKEND